MEAFVNICASINMYTIYNDTGYHYFNNSVINFIGKLQNKWKKKFVRETIRKKSNLWIYFIRTANKKFSIRKKYGKKCIQLHMKMHTDSTNGFPKFYLSSSRSHDPNKINWFFFSLFVFLPKWKKKTGQYIDLDYSIWLWRALTPLIITFLLPLVFVLLIYLSSLFLYIYKLHR